VNCNCSNLHPPKLATHAPTTTGWRMAPAPQVDVHTFAPCAIVQNQMKQNIPSKFKPKPHTQLHGHGQHCARPPLLRHTRPRLMHISSANKRAPGTQPNQTKRLWTCRGARAYRRCLLHAELESSLNKFGYNVRVQHTWHATSHANRMHRVEALQALT
jgi:hypothetical protein